MNIQVYKPGFDTKFINKDNSTTFINPEIVNLITLLSSAKHGVSLLSPSDAVFPMFKKVDIKILINGRLYLKLGDEIGNARVKEDVKNIKKIFNNTTPQYHIITDLKIVNKNEEVLKNIKFDGVLTQCLEVGTYVEYEKIFLYKNYIINNKHRYTKIIYIGNSRDGARDAGILGVLVNSKVKFDLYGNWDLEKWPMSKGKLLYSESQRVLSKYKYGVCLTEELYVNFGHRTPRIYEYMLAGAIPFVETRYPRDLAVISENDFRVVNSGEELKLKIKFLEKNEHYRKELQKQGYKIVKKYFSGEIVKNKLLKALNIKRN